MTENEKQIATAKKLLRKAGFALYVDGCGCCASPWVWLSHNGADIIYHVDAAGHKIPAENAVIKMRKTGETQ